MAEVMIAEDQGFFTGTIAPVLNDTGSSPVHGDRITPAAPNEIHLVATARVNAAATIPPHAQS